VERYSEYKDSEVSWLGVIPKTWDIYRIKNLLLFHQSGAWGEDACDEYGDRVCIRVADFNFEQLAVNSDEYTIRNYMPSQIGKLQLQVGDILIEKSGGGEKSPVGRVVLFDKDFSALYANFIEAIRPNKIVVNRFLGYIFASAYHNGVNRKYFNQTTGIQNLNIASYICEKVGIPSFAEQTIITDYLDHMTGEINRLIIYLQSQVTMLDRYKRELINDAITHGIDKNISLKDSGVDWIGNVPPHWKIIPLRAFLKVVSVKNNPKLPLLSVEREKGVVDRETEGSDSNYNHIPDDLSNYKVVNPGQFVINKMKAWRGSYGVSPYNGIVSPAYYVFNLNFPNPDFFNYAIRSGKYIGFFGRDSYGIRTDQWDFKIEKIKNIPFAVPPVSEQQAIVKYLNKKIPVIESSIDNINNQIEKLKQYRQIVIHDAVTGKVKVKEINKNGN